MSATPLLVLVVGCQRSGTTLMGQMLGAHPQALLVDEDEGAYTLLDALYQQRPLAPLLEELLPKARLKYRDARRDVDTAPTHVVLKAPNATFHADTLARSDTPMSFVFAARDVREVVHSMAHLHVPFARNQHRRMTQVPAIATRFAEEIALLDDPAVPEHIKLATVWRVKTGLYRDFCRPPLDALLVRYDAMVENVEAWLARMQAHAGLPACLDTLHHDVMDGTAIGRTDRRRAVDASSRAKWRQSLTPAQLDEIRAVAGGLMDELGLPW